MIDRPKEEVAVGQKGHVVKNGAETISQIVHC